MTIVELPLEVVVESMITAVVRSSIVMTPVELSVEVVVESS